MLFNFVGREGFEPPAFLKYQIVLGEMYDISILPLFPSNNFLNGFFHYYSLAQLHLRCRLPIFQSQICQRPCFKNRCKYTNNFLIFQIFFNIFFSHEKRNRTFITTIITTARRFTIKLPHGVILLTFMTSMQRRGLEPLHPVFTTGALTY